MIITRIDQLNPQKKYSYADYLKWQFDELVELINGKLFRMSPAPSRLHQKISGNTFVLLSNFLNEKSCDVYHAPFDVRLPDPKKSSGDEQVFSVVQPDICIICDKGKLDDRGCIGAPDLIVEILSPATRKKDLNEKFKLYEQSGVLEYWIVQPNDQTVTVFDLTNDKYLLRKIYGAEEMISGGVFPELVIDLTKVFEIPEL